jgi:predicted permease
LKPLPFDEPGRIASVSFREQGATQWRPFSLEEYSAVAPGATLFSELAARTFLPLSLAADDAPRMVQTELVSANYFAMLRIAPLRGRTFDTASDAPQAVISEQLWQRRFNGDASIVGRRIRLNGREATVVGVAPPGFVGATQLIRADLWLSTDWFTRLNSTPNASGAPSFGVLGRLAPGATRAQAQSHLDSLLAGLDRAALTARVDSPDALGFGGAVRPLIIGGSALLFVLMGLVVSVAVANVAGLLLARAPARRPEIGIRLALGATSGRIVRQVMTECLMLGAAGSMLGVLLSLLLIRLVPSAAADLPDYLVYAVDPQLDWRVLALAALAAIVVSVAVGVAPARHAASTPFASALKAAAANRSGRRSTRVLNALVVAQMAVSTMLLVGSVLLAQAYVGARTADPGMDLSNGLAASLDLGQTALTPEQGVRLYGTVLDRVAALPGVESAAFSREVPLFLSAADGVAVGEGSADRKVVTPNYFATLRLPLLQGRDFRAADRAPVAIVNETLAAALWPGRSPLGEVLRAGESALEVIGVARDAKYSSLSETPRPVFYEPLSQHYSSQMTLLVRSASAAALADDVRAAVRAENPDLAVVVMRTFEELLRVELAPRQRNVVFLGSLCGLALLFSSVGLYGVISFGVRERVAEFGLRVALGAEVRDVRAMVLGRGMRLAAAGLGLGLLGALGVAQVLRFVLADVPAVSALTFGIVAVTLAAVALFASYWPARFATRVDPVVALRGD